MSGGSDEVVIYDYWRSSASYRVRIGLNLAAVAYRAVPVDLLAGEHRAPEHRARNPQGLVPALAIDGTMLTQSLAILDYLAETRGLAILPDDPRERALVRALAQSLTVDVHPVCNLSVATSAAELAGDPDAKSVWMRHFIRPGLEAHARLLERFGEQRFSTGAVPSLADLCLVPQLYNARRWGVGFDDLPRLAGIEAQCAALPAFARAHPDAVRPA